jgi:hypothetical protein
MRCRRIGSTEAFAKRFFNISVSERGTLLKDTEYPICFEEWKRERIGAEVA